VTQHYATCSYCTTIVTNRLHPRSLNILRSHLPNLLPRHTLSIIAIIPSRIHRAPRSQFHTTAFLTRKRDSGKSPPIHTSQHDAIPSQCISMHPARRTVLLNIHVPFNLRLESSRDSLPSSRGPHSKLPRSPNNKSETTNPKGRK
jgi:hypothetical protein